MTKLFKYLKLYYLLTKNIGASQWESPLLEMLDKLFVTSSVTSSGAESTPEHVHYTSLGI